jgi:regulator of sigma E protease
MMNLTLTLLIFWGINFFHGKEIAKSTTVASVDKGSLAEEAGFQSFDKIISVNDVKVKDWQEVASGILTDNKSGMVKITVERDGTVQSFNVSSKFIKEKAQNKLFLFPYPTQALVFEVLKNSPAQDAGLKSGDLILSLNSTTIKESIQINDIITANQDKSIPVVLLRDKDTIKTSVKPALDGKIGISHKIAYVGEIEYRTYGFFESIPYAITEAKDFTLIFFRMMKEVFTGKIAFKDAFGGPVKIAQYAASSADSGGVSFLYFLAMLSLNLAIINILPFPVLDGGHFVIILLEGIFKRELPIKIKMIIQNIGFALLLLLMAFIIYNDVISL